MKHIFISAALLTSSSFVNASTSIKDKTIEKVHLNFSAGVYLQTQEPMDDPENCGSATWYRVEKSSEFEKEAYSMMLAAFASNKKINIGISGCVGQNPKITWINIHS